MSGNARWTVAGAMLGIAWSLSPLTVLFALLLPLLYVWTVRGLEPWERRWAVSLLAVATLLRVAAIAVLVLATSPAQHFNTYFPDAQFAIARSWWIRNVWLDVPIGPVYRYVLYDRYGATSHSYVLGAIQLLVGQSPYGLNVISTAAYLAGAIALYRIARQSFGAGAAIVAFGVLLFWPTTFAWSVSMLKEPMQFALAAFLLAFALRAVRSRTVRARLAGALLASVTAYALLTLKSAEVYVAVAGCVVGVIGWMMTRRPSAVAVSAVLIIAAGTAALSRPSARDQAMEIVRAAADRQRGHVTSTGYGYRVLDQRFYSYGPNLLRTLDPDEAVRFLVRATIAFFTVPLPWETVSRTGLLYLPQQLIWYGLLLLAIPGVAAGLRRDPLVAWLLLATVAAGVAVIAPNSGNIGTLVRHRDMILPALALLAAAGIASTLAWLTRGAALRSPKALRSALPI